MIRACIGADMSCKRPLSTIGELEYSAMFIHACAHRVTHLKARSLMRMRSKLDWA